MKLFVVILLIFITGCTILPSGEEEVKYYFEAPQEELDYETVHPDSLSPFWRPQKNNRRTLTI